MGRDLCPLVYSVSGPSEVLSECEGGHRADECGQGSLNKDSALPQGPGLVHPLAFSQPDKPPQQATSGFSCGFFKYGFCRYYPSGTKPT